MSVNVVFGVGIGLLNLINYNQSPLYLHRQEGENKNLLTLKFVGGLIVKSYIYGLFWPFATFGMVSHIFSNHPDFQTHFILFSKYGNYKKRNEETK